MISNCIWFPCGVLFLIIFQCVCITLSRMDLASTFHGCWIGCWSHSYFRGKSLAHSPCKIYHLRKAWCSWFPHYFRYHELHGFLIRFCIVIHVHDLSLSICQWIVDDDIMALRPSPTMRWGQHFSLLVRSRVRQDVFWNVPWLVLAPCWTHVGRYLVAVGTF